MYRDVILIIELNELYDEDNELNIDMFGGMRLVPFTKVANLLDSHLKI